MYIYVYWYNMYMYMYMYMNMYMYLCVYIYIYIYIYIYMCVCVCIHIDRSNYIVTFSIKKYSKLKRTFLRTLFLSLFFGNIYSLFNFICRWLSKEK